MDADQPAARPQRLDERRDDLRGLEFEARLGAVRLGGDDEIIVGGDAPRPRQDRIEQKGVILAPEGEDDGPQIDGIARALDPGPPVFGQKPLEIGDLLGEAVRRVAGERDILPDQALRGGGRARRQPRRLGVIEVRQDEHGRRMFEQAIGHFLERHPHVFVRDLLGDDIERHGRKARVHRPHDPRQNGAVADAGVEHPDRRRSGMDVGEFERDAMGDLGLLAAGRDEQEIFLPIVEEAEAGRGRVRLRLAARRGDEAGQACGPWRGLQRGPAYGQKGADLLQRFRGDPRAVAKPRDELPVVDDAPSEGRFRGPRFATEIPDLAEDLLVRGAYGLRGAHGLALAKFETHAQFRLSAPAQSQAAGLCGVNHNPSGRTEWAAAHSCGTEWERSGG